MSGERQTDIDVFGFVTMPAALVMFSGMLRFVWQIERENPRPRLRPSIASVAARRTHVESGFGNIAAANVEQAAKGKFYAFSTLSSS